MCRRNTSMILIKSILPGKWFVYGKFWMSGCIVNVKFVGWIKNESQQIQHWKPLVIQLENTQFNESFAISQNALVNIQPPRGHSLVRHNTCKRHQQTFSVESHTWLTPFFIIICSFKLCNLKKKCLFSNELIKAS